MDRRADDRVGSYVQNRSQNRPQPPRRPLIPHSRSKKGKLIPGLPTRLLFRRCIHRSPARIFHHPQHKPRPPSGPPRPPRSILRLSPFPLRRSQLYPSETPSNYQHRASTPKMVELFPLAFPDPQFPTTDNPPSLPPTGPSHIRSGDPRISAYVG